MRALDRYNPFAVALYYLTVIGIAMFCMHPILLSVSLAGAICCYYLYCGTGKGGRHAYFWGLFLLTALLNPLLSHNGATVLLVLGDKPFTLEALVWGAVCGGGILAVLYWICSFGALMTEDKLLYLLGKLSPRLSLVLSMAVRYVSLFAMQAKRIKQAQIALGLYKEDNIIDRIRGGIRIFSVLLSWALENGIVTANSMTARGFGTGRRTHFARFGFKAHDALLLGATLTLGAAAAVPMLLGAAEFTFYPTLHLQSGTLSWLCYLSYGALVALPMLIETEDTVRWKSLRSRI